MRLSPRKGKKGTADAETQAELRTLADRLYPGLFAYLYRLTGDWDLAQDLSRASFVRLALRPLPAPADRRGRLYRIATALACRAAEACGRPGWQRRARRALRRTTRVPKSPVVPAAGAAGPGAAAPEAEDALAGGSQAARWGRPGPLEEGLARLPFGERAALLLCDHHGFVPGEAAVALSTRPGQVRRQVQNGRAALRRAYAAAGVTGSQRSRMPGFLAGPSAETSTGPGQSDSSDLADQVPNSFGAGDKAYSVPAEHASIAALLDRGEELGPAAQAQVAQHASICPACAERLALDERVKTDLARLPDPWPSHRSRETLRAAVLHPQITVGRKSPARGRRWPALVIVALLILGITSGALFLLVALAGNSQAARPDNLPAAAATFPAVVTARPTPIPTRAPTGGLSGDAVSWLQANAIPITTTQPGGSNADLAPLKDMIGSARIVALADSAYGTHELTEMQQRIMQYLITDAGFRTLAVEAAAPPADLVNDYLAGSQQDAEQLTLLLTGGFRQTQELLDTIHWLRALNQSSYAPRVQFRGFDLMQEYSHYAQDTIVEYLKLVDPAAVERVYGNDGDLLSYLEQRRSDYTAAASEGKAPRSAYGRALRAARALVQYDAYAQAPDAAARGLLRTQSMLENVSSVLRMSGSGGRIVLWGNAADLGVYPGRRSLGAQLRDRFGKDYAVFDLAFYEGAVSSAVARPGQAPGPIAIQRVPPAAAGTWEDFLHQAGPSLYLLNFQHVLPDTDVPDMAPTPTPAPLPGSAGVLGSVGTANRAGALPSGSAVAWLRSDHYARSVGSFYSECYPEDYYTQVSLPEAFDGVIFSEHTSAATLLFQLPQASTAACPAEPQNLDFSSGTQGWVKGGTAAGAYIVGVHPAAPDGSAPAAGYIRPPRPEPSGTGTLMQAFRADSYRSQRVRLTTKASANDTDGEAYLWLKIEGIGGQRLAFAIQSIPNSDPQARGLVIDVPAGATRISFGVEMQSRGEVWISDARFETVGQEIPLSPLRE